MNKQQTRNYNATLSVNIVSAVSMIFREPYPQDYIILFAIKACSYKANVWVTKERIRSMIMMEPMEFGAAFSRVRSRKLVAYDRTTEHINLTDKGKAETLRIQRARTEIWRRYQEQIKKERIKNFIHDGSKKIKGTPESRAK